MRPELPEPNEAKLNDTRVVDVRTRVDSTLLTRRNVASGTRRLARLGDRLGSPTALAASVLVLVSTVGLVSTISTYRALQRSGHHSADASLSRRAAQLRESLSGAFGTADPLLAELVPMVTQYEPGTSFEPILQRMRVLGTERRGMAWISASFPDGSFAGIYLDEDGRILATESRTGTPHGTERQMDFDASHRLREVSTQPTDYDPRTRGFYQLAERGGTSAWTAPYPFLPHLRTGVTRVEPVFRTRPAADATPPLRRELAGVLTYDLDTTELAKLLDRPIVRHERLAVVTDDGAVLAFTGTRLPRQVDRSQTIPLRIANLHDAALSRAARVVRERGPSSRSRITSDGRWFHVDRRTLLRLGDQRISLLSVLPEDELYAPARREAFAGVLITAITALAGLALALALAANIARLRRKRVEAELEVARAQARVAELGSYQLISQIGSGGMGEVWRARHKLLARDAALKLIRADDRPDSHASERNQRFFDEAKTLARMRSIHTVAVYDFGIADDGRYFLAMELLDGLDLDELVRRYGPLPPSRTAGVLAQICDSLAEAHDAGLVHQDIKPANVYLCQLAEALDLVKVLDFGLTRAIGKRHGSSNTVEGTPAFMAPEQATGGSVGPAADLYAVGCVGYWLLTGRFAYEADTSADLMRAHVSSPVPQLPDDVIDRSPPALVQLITRCLAKKPDRRPSSARALASALRAVALDCEETFTRADRAAFWGNLNAARTELTKRSHENSQTLEGPSLTIRVQR